MAAPLSTSFRCNVCGKDNPVARSPMPRDQPSCRKCASSVRTRSMIHGLTTELFGACLTIAEIPEVALRGIGMSDLRHYAVRLGRRVHYTNTFLHKRPRLDITAIGGTPFRGLDFVLSSDVFEHVHAPVPRAFQNTRALLKPGGLLVFSVPYGLEGPSLEHFPGLADYRIEGHGDLRRLINTAADGTVQVFDNLVFHGGRGSVLELRIFTLPDLRRYLEDAGFGDVKVHGEDHADCGMTWEHPWSVTLTARAV